MSAVVPFKPKPRWTSRTAVVRFRPLCEVTVILPDGREIKATCDSLVEAHEVAGGDLRRSRSNDGVG